MGFFITFEGVDKAGKSTQIRLLAKRFQEMGKAVLCTREPGGTPLGEEVRELVMKNRAENIADETELLLFSASRAQLLRERIWPALEEGQVVLCDRFADSTTAYQGYARGMDLAFIRQLNQFALGNRWPDLTILLDLTVEESFARLDNVLKATAADSDRFEIEGRRFHEAVRNGFLQIAKENPRRFVTFSAAKPVEELADEIWSAVSRRFL
ncbi:MAG: dTMP kinase [Lentisphaeria bacterium]|nr:dTMP kinase [Lentisphaeria bacterium]